MILFLNYIHFLDEDLSKEDLLESNPRPKERVAIFKEKLNHMQNILSGNASEIESMSDKKRLKPEEMRSSKEKCGQWIEKLKNDLNGKQNGKTIEPTVKDRRVFANVRAALCSDDLDTNVDGKESGNIRAKAFSNGKTSKHEGTSGKVHLDELEHLRNVFNQQSNYRSTKTKLVINSDSKSIKNDDKTTGRWKSTNKLSNNVGNASRSSLSSCCRCGDKVLTVDKIIVGGNHFHRSCLTCSKCGVTLRLSEVRNAINLCHEQKPALCSYECILCAKNKSNTLTSTTRGKETRAPAPNEQFVSSCSALDPKPEDEYERKLKERMKWKEMFLLNSEAAASNGISGATKTAQSPLKERIEFENSSISFELYDEDELTKMLNLDPPDSWVNPEEEEEDEEDSDEPIEMKPVNEQLSSNRKTEINSKNNDNEEEDDDDEATSTTFDESTDDDINSDQFDMSEDVEKNSIEDAELPTIVVSDEHTPPVSDDANSDSLTLNELQDVQNEAAGSLTNSRQTSTVASSSSTKSKSNSRVCSKNASPASTRTKSASPSSSGKSKSDSSSDDTFSDLNLVSVVNDTTTGASIEISRKLQTPPEDQSDWSTTIVSHYHDSELNRALIDAEPIDKDDTTTTNESTFSFRVETPKLFSSENYSKIPVLATRLDASSSPRPVYCGSFTEKLLKCRSSPTLNQQMNKSLNLTGQVNPLSPSPLGDKEPRTGSSSPTSKGPHSLGYPHFWNLSSSALLEGRKG